MHPKYRSHTISKGTLDIDDLLYRCFGFVCRANLPMDQTEMEILAATERCMAGMVYYGNPKTNRKKRMRLLTKNVFSMLERISPRGCFFGIHPGDPGRVGFWPKSLRFQQ